MPNELLYSVAKQFGWNLTNGQQNQNLWEYVLGTNETGTPLTGSNTIGDPAVSGKDITYTIWRRIINNLPLLLKSKGTKRSVQALLSCYGIPQSMISINEYGGPRLDRAPIYEKLNFDGRKLKSISVVIKNKKGLALGFLCINLDVSVFTKYQGILNAFLSDFDSSKSQETETIFKDDLYEQLNHYRRLSVGSSSV